MINNGAYPLCISDLLNVTILSEILNIVIVITIKYYKAILAKTKSRWQDKENNKNPHSGRTLHIECRT